MSTDNDDIIDGHLVEVINGNNNQFNMIEERKTLIQQPTITIQKRKKITTK